MIDVGRHRRLRLKMTVELPMGFCPVECKNVGWEPAILLNFINRPSGETDSIYEANVK